MNTDIIRQRLLLFLFISSISLLLVLPVSVHAQAAGNAFSELDANRQTVAMAINQMRTQAGLPPLALNSLLNQAAQNHVNDMIANYNYSHAGSDGSNVRQRVQRTGYAASPWVSENWVSVNDPSMAIQWWMNSYVHRNNILNGNWHELGIGGAYQAGNSQFIFVAVFAAGESGDSVLVIPPEPQPLPIPAGGMQYQIQPGDTLLSIGLRYGVEWPMIAGANGLSEYSLLQIGQVIRIPGVENVGGYVGDQVQAASTTQAVSFVEPENSNTFIRRYTVQAGDTLDRIAGIYDISWQDLARENGLGEYSVLSVGKEIRIPGAIQKKPSESVAEPSVQAQAAALVASEHVIGPGDTIISIALQYDMDWQDLLRLNNLTESSVLRLGQTIRLQ